MKKKKISNNDTILQYFEWNLPADQNHWNWLQGDAAEAAELGITMACQSIAGNNFGAGQHDRVRATLKIAFSVAFVYAAVFESLFVFLARPLGAVFVDDPQVIAEVGRIMPVTTATYAFSAPLMVLGGYYQALGMAGSAAILNLVRTYVIGLPLLALLPFAAGEFGIWIAYPVGDVVMWGVVAALLVWNARRHHLAWGIFHPRPA